MDLSFISMDILDKCLMEKKTLHKDKVTLCQFISNQVLVIYCQVTNHSKKIYG